MLVEFWCPRLSSMLRNLHSQATAPQFPRWRRQLSLLPHCTQASESPVERAARFGVVLHVPALLGFTTSLAQ